MITAAAYTMTWLDDDPYEDAIWAVLTGFVAEDALRILDAEPLFVRKELSNTWDGWLDWLEGGVSLGSDSDYKFIKKIGGVKRQLEVPKEIAAEFVEVLNQDDCDMITTSAHATEHFFKLGYPDTTSDGWITHNEKGDLYGIDTLGKVHHVNAKKPKIYYAPGNCLIGHIDGQSCLSLAWIHNGVNAFFGHMYNQDRPCYAWAIAEYFIALQGQYTFAEATYAHWLALRFSMDELLEAYPCCDWGSKGTILYGDPAWEARLKRTVMPAYSQDLDIEHLANDRIKITARITIHHKWSPWVVPGVRPVILLPFRIKEATIEKSDVDKVGVADNFILLDLGTPSIGGNSFPLGTKRSVVLYARELKVWPFLADTEVVKRVRERKLNNISRSIDILTDETVDPNDRIKKHATWDQLLRTSEIPAVSYEKETELLNKLIMGLDSDYPMIRYKAAQIIGYFHFRPSVSVPTLRRSLKDESIWKREKDQISVRSAAISSLGMFGKDANDTQQDIVQLLPNLSSNEKTVALRTLGKIGGGDDEVFELLREIATDPNFPTDPNTKGIQNKIRLAAIDGLGSFGTDDPRVRKILFSLIDDESESVRTTSIKILASAEQGDDEIIKALVNGLEDKSWRVRVLAIRGLTNFEAISEEIVGKIISATKDESWQVRYNAVRGLSTLKTASPNVEKALQEATRDSYPYVGELAKEALQKFGSKIQD
jgi:HEAT repeat protein